MRAPPTAEKALHFSESGGSLAVHNPTNTSPHNLNQNTTHQHSLTFIIFIQYLQTTTNASN